MGGRSTTILIWSKLLGEARPVIEDAIALGGEAGADVLEEVDQQSVVGGVEQFDAEAGFEGGELGEHGCKDYVVTALHGYMVTWLHGYIECGLTGT